MNILVPDSWLRTFLKTKATPSQLKEYLSLCGPSIERIYDDSGEPVYDVEITTNRPDAMSVFGIAREASVILPQFSIAAELLYNPYLIKPIKASGDNKLLITTDAKLNPRWTSVVLGNVTVKDSPKWLQDWLTRTGIRPINTIVDITNYLMRAYGQPAHAFDYDAIAGHTMKLRASIKGEKLTTLDGKLHVLPGDDIVIEDGSGRLIDLCGIMGGENSAITPTTKNVVLFLQTYEPVHIRKTSMKLAHRTEAAGLFEKGVDSELVLPALMEGVRLAQEIAGANVASRLYDLYPKPFTPYAVTAKKTKIHSYMGIVLPDRDVKSILTNLGFTTSVTKGEITVRVPSFRRDVTLDVDIIEEIARIYGYQNIPSTLPNKAPPGNLPDPHLLWEETIKTRLRDWGYTELVTYSMISEKTMQTFSMDPKEAYKISNPLSDEWVYLRPQLFPTTITAAIQNLGYTKNLKVFELSMAYLYRPNDLPIEKSTLIVLWSGEKFLEAKGLANAICTLFGVDFDAAVAEKKPHMHSYYTQQSITVGDYGSLGVLNQALLDSLQVKIPMTRLYMNFDNLVRDARPTKQYIPVPNHPSSDEDLALVVPEQFEVGPLIAAMKAAHPLVRDVTLLDVHEQTRTLHVTYMDPKKTLTAYEILPVRQKLLALALNTFGATLKSN